MTRKHYVMLAAALKAARDNPITEDELEYAATLEMQEVCAQNIADALARDNPAFDRERFLKAAGVQS